jgi:hypothetical protein
MQITAKVTQVLPPVTGNGTNGAWKKQEIIVEYEDHFPRKLCISFFNDKIKEELLQVGSMLTIYFDLESREFNGRWYTDVRGWKVEPAVSVDQKPTERVNEPVEAVDTHGITVEDDLPF